MRPTEVLMRQYVAPTLPSAKSYTLNNTSCKQHKMVSGRARLQSLRKNSGSYQGMPLGIPQVAEIGFGKGTTSVVPPGANQERALAPEGPVVS